MDSKTKTPLEIPSEINVVILDGYIDEPGLLGVPPYISPKPRLIAGVLNKENKTYRYITADQYRENPDIIGDPEILVVHGGVTVPGKYLGGKPLTPYEAEMAGQGNHTSFLGGPLARNEKVIGYDHKVEKDLPAYLSDYLSGKKPVDRWMENKEKNRWLMSGASVVKQHPSYPDPLLCEISAYRGCPRYITGGCSFCSEPQYGKPSFRKPKDIINEISTLYSHGVRHYRLGGQSCILSYQGKGVGLKETPEPRPRAIKELFKGIWSECPDIKTLHLDNANPQVIYEYPEKSREILKTLREHTTPGNVLAFGLETADPEVIKANNLNTGPEETLEAIRIVNKIGSERGENGLPQLLPGLNFLGGLHKENPDTYKKNTEFLKKILKEDLLLRRTNIRQVKSHEEEFRLKYPREFMRFKKKVRKEIDRPILKRMLPRGTILKDVYIEKNREGNTLGRQVGTYPILTKINYEIETGKYKDIAVTGHGYRSITGVEHPVKIKEAGIKKLSEIPGVGSQRAARIFRNQPKTKNEFIELFNNKEKASEIYQYIEL